MGTTIDCTGFISEVNSSCNHLRTAFPEANGWTNSARDALEDLEEDMQRITDNPLLYPLMQSIHDIPKPADADTTKESDNNDGGESSESTDDEMSDDSEATEYREWQQRS